MHNGIVRVGRAYVDRVEAESERWGLKNIRRDSDAFS